MAVSRRRRAPTALIGISRRSSIVRCGSVAMSTSLRSNRAAYFAMPWRSSHARTACAAAVPYGGSFLSGRAGAPLARGGAVVTPLPDAAASRPPLLAPPWAPPDAGACGGGASAGCSGFAGLPLGASAPWAAPPAPAPAPATASPAPAAPPSARAPAVRLSSPLSCSNGTNGSGLVRGAPPEGRRPEGSARWLPCPRAPWSSVNVSVKRIAPRAAASAAGEAGRSTRLAAQPPRGRCPALVERCADPRAPGFA
mmetsp:Transcript_2428/g.8595  ORF Transcript_2428/g.8595 Transcript_2428/m.8595 type:complete len:253 (-) Transcript_2428:37-795(-)